MSEFLQFSVDHVANEGRFHVVLLLDHADAALGRPEAVLKEMSSLIETFPDLIDAHVIRGTVFAAAYPKKALEYYQRAFAIGMSEIPAGFDGTIRWSEPENQPFLRAVFNLAQTYQVLGDHQKAVNLLERSLAWNPGDELGCAALLAEPQTNADAKPSADGDLDTRPRL